MGRSLKLKISGGLSFKNPHSAGGARWGGTRNSVSS